MNNGNLYKEISKVAYELYEKSERVEGHDLNNWLDAEKIVMELHGKLEKLESKISASKKRASTTKRSVRKKFTTKAKRTKT